MNLLATFVLLAAMTALFMTISLRMDSLLSTHPATENRIAELEALAQKIGQVMGQEMGYLDRQDPQVEDGYMGNEPDTGSTEQQSNLTSRRPWGSNTTPPKGPWS